MVEKDNNTLWGLKLVKKLREFYATAGRIQTERTSLTTLAEMNTLNAAWDKFYRIKPGANKAKQ